MTRHPSSPIGGSTCVGLPYKLLDKDAHPMNQRQFSYATAGEAILAFGAVVWGLLFARFVLAIVFRPYDDEGYFLLALARYFRPGPPDPGTFSHYGPFYYYAQQACFRLLGLPVTHDAGRSVALLCWMASALLGGVFVFRISRSLLLGAAATLACIRVGVVLAQEPGHPQQVVLVLFLLASCLSLSVGSPRNRVSLFVLGAVGAALVFTKINVGAFYLAARAHALLCVLPASRVRTAGIGILLAYALLAPPLLVHSRLWTGSGGYCVVAILVGAATFAGGAFAAPDPPLDLRRAWVAVAGAVSGTVLIVAATMWQGVSLPALIEGVILEPARQPGLLSMGLRLGWAPCVATVVVLSGIGCLGWFRERLATYRFWVGALRCEVALAAMFLLVRHDLAWVVPFLPLGLIPVMGRTWHLAEWFPRLFIADLAATQFLQTYPVAGSQVGIASLPVLLWAFVCLSDGVEELGGLARGPSRVGNAAAGGLIVLLLATGMYSLGARPSGYPYPPSGLRGADGLHLPPLQAENYRFLAGSITANCSVLFTLPRSGSFNFWSGVPAPYGSNAIVSMKSFTWERQKPILDLLQSDPRACVLYNRELLEFWQTTAQDLAQLPLAVYILDEMPKAAEQGGYEIRINPHRNSLWVPYLASSAR